ncbi:MAG: Phenylacetic acid catabolic protein [Solirubrobacterales bacterium]
METPVVLAWCDDLFIQGHQLSGWIVDYVDLEQSLAVGSIAQELLAHSAALMGICGLSAEQRDGRVFRRNAPEWYPSRIAELPDHNWAACVARGFLLNRAMLRLRERIPLPGSSRVQQLTEVIHAEQDLHAVHWLRWIRIMSNDPSLRAEFEIAMVAAVDDAADMFAPPQGAGDDELLPGGSLLAGHEHFISDVDMVMREHGLEVPKIVPTPRLRQPGGAWVEEILVDLRFARLDDGRTQYEVYR